MFSISRALELEMNTIFFFPNPAQGHFAFSTSPSPNTQDLICGFIPYLLPFHHSYLRPRHFTLLFLLMALVLFFQTLLCWESSFDFLKIKQAEHSNRSQIRVIQ